MSWNALSDSIQPWFSTSWVECNACLKKGSRERVMCAIGYNDWYEEQISWGQRKKIDMDKSEGGFGIWR